MHLPFGPDSKAAARRDRRGIGSVVGWLAPGGRSSPFDRGRSFPVHLVEVIAMAFDTYMQIGDGKDVVGEATAAGIPAGAFELHSFSWGASNPTKVGTTGGGLSAGKVSVSSFSVM